MKSAHEIARATAATGGDDAPTRELVEKAVELNLK
jgi:hypothetical protein